MSLFTMHRSTVRLIREVNTAFHPYLHQDRTSLGLLLSLDSSYDGHGVATGSGSGSASSSSLFPPPFNTHQHYDTGDGDRFPFQTERDLEKFLDMYYSQ